MEAIDRTTRVHLVLSSGGARTVSYAGALSQLTRNGVSFASVSACSAGSFIGAMLCCGLEPEQIENHLRQLDFHRFFTRKAFLWSNFLFYPFAKYRRSSVDEVFRDIVGKDPTFAELQIPLGVVGVNLISKNFLVYSDKTTPEMHVSEALKIGMAVPFTSPPYDPRGKLVVDAAIATESPLWVATDRGEDLPIIVLRPSRKPGNVPASMVGYIQQIIAAGTESRDQQLMEQIPGVCVIEIECGDVEATQVDLPEQQRDFLMENGRYAVDKAIKIYGRDFRFNTAPMPRTVEPANRDDAAERGAGVMIRNFNQRLPQLLRDQVFISYSRDDADWLKRFQTALSVYVRNQSFRVWDDTQIDPGADWKGEIDRALDSTRVALLLVTPNFLASDFISKNELPYFLERAKEKEVRIFWVAVGYVPFEEIGLERRQSANDVDSPLISLEPAEQEKVIRDICRKIKKVFTPTEDPN